jgi:hypothetical protein
MTFEKYSRLQLKQLKHLHEQVEARRNRVKNTAFMNELREHQTRNNYKLEYDRIRNSLADSIVPHHTKEIVKKRMNTLNKLITKAL